jgi:hypothetical protein
VDVEHERLSALNRLQALAQSAKLSGGCRSSRYQGSPDGNQSYICSIA